MDTSVFFLGNLVLTLVFAALMLAEYFRGGIPFAPVVHGRACQKSIWRNAFSPATVLVLAGVSLILAVISFL